jgi:hypothetical protein
MTPTMACMKCNRAVPVGELCPTCAEFSDTEKDSMVRREIISAVRRRRPVWTDPTEWKGLTDKEIYNIDYEKKSFYEAAKLIEGMLKERNT